MTGRGLLLRELEHIVDNCCNILMLVKRDDLDWTPHDDLRPLGGLANYVAQIPAVDLKIILGRNEREINSLENDLACDDPQRWVEIMREGLSELIRYFEDMSFDEFENNSGTAYYGRTQTNAQWLVEIITNIYHHRSLLWTMLKLKGYDVTTRTLYE